MTYDFSWSIDCRVSFAEQLEFDVINMAPGSVTVSLSCNRTATSSFSYVLENENTMERSSFTIKCGDSIALSDLSATTDYFISRGLGEITCKVKNFTTASDGKLLFVK